MLSVRGKVLHLFRFPLEDGFMNTHNRASLRVEQLETRYAPSATATLLVTPPANHANGAFHATHVAPQGCDNGISLHASANGVVSCVNEA